MVGLREMRRSRILAVLVLTGIAVTLSACVSDSSPIGTGPQAAPATGVPGAPTPTPTVAPIPRNKVVATVDGTPIAGSEFADVTAQQRIQVAQQAAQQGTTPLTELQIRANALSYLIVRDVLNIYAQKHNVTVTPAEIQRQYDSVQIQYGTPISFTQTLATYGFTPQSYKNQLRTNILAQKIIAQVAPLPKTISEAEARHILVKTKAEATSILQQLQHGASFAVLARKYSIDNGLAAGSTLTGTAKLQAEQQSSAFNGGWLRDPSQPFAANKPTWLTPATQFVAPVLNAILTMKPGEIRVVQSQFGWHVIKVEAHRNLPYGQADQTLRQYYSGQGGRQQQTFTAWLTAERKRDNVKILVKGLPITQ